MILNSEDDEAWNVTVSCSKYCIVCFICHYIMQLLESDKCQDYIYESDEQDSTQSINEEEVIILCYV